MKKYVELLVLFIFKIVLAQSMESFGILQNQTNNECSSRNFNMDLNSGKSFRGLQLVSDDQTIIQSRREPRLFSFSTDEQDVNVSN